MALVKYDSYLLDYKSPFGAVATDVETTFSIDIKKTEEPSNVTFVYRHDQTDSPIYISMQMSGEYDEYFRFSCKVSFEKADLYFYRFEYDSYMGRRFIGQKDHLAQVEDWLPEWQLTVYDKSFKTPNDVKGGVMYQIFPDRFCRGDGYELPEAKNPRKIHKNWYDVPEFIYDTPGYAANDYYGGNIQGVIERLEYLKSLGVSIIYFNPVFESPEYHRYSTANYFNIDPYFGTNEQFALLTQKCRELGIKVILDGVFSHTGADSIYFNKYSHYDSCGAYNSESSPYRNWYNFIEYPHRYECWWNFDNLPNVNELAPDYLDYITGEDGVLSFWQGMGTGGWRLDVADELPDGFLDALYRRVKQTDPEALVIGEVWEDATNKFAYNVRRRYLLGGQMDSVMNYPWRSAILDFVVGADEGLFHSRIMSILENYPKEATDCLMNIISTHDTVRTITHFGVEHYVPDEQKGAYKMTPEEYEKGKKRLMLAAFLQFTLPGIPCIYYGDEVGLEGFRDPYCRMGYPYGNEDGEILSFYKEIAKIRSVNKDDFTSSFVPHIMGNGFYSFTRGNLICAINLGEEEQTLDTQNAEIVFSHGEVREESNSVNLAPNSAVILKQKIENE